MDTSFALFCARALLDELVLAGVRTACVAPGSRSTALALAVAERSDVVAHVLTDERSMGFFALGVARATRRPVALVCTSGTAAANLLPAVIEASLGGGALVLLTADRPPELRDCAAPQTIDQVGLFGSHARWAVDVPLLDASTGAARVLRSLASRAAAAALEGEGGPVHLNVPLREPFVDASFPSRERFEAGARADGQGFTRVVRGSVMGDADIGEIAARLAGATRGVIVCAGRELPAASIAAVAEALDWPILADPLCGLRFGPHDRSRVVDAVEPLLRDDALRAALRPDAILRFGLTPAPRSVQRWLEDAWPAECVVVDEAAWPDPMRAASTVVRAGAEEFCAALATSCAAAGAAPAAASAETTGGAPAAGTAALSWRARWTSLSAAARAALDDGLDSEVTLFDAAVLRRLARVLPDGATLVVGNSMPVRDADAFLAGSERRLRVMANRGASGIDGVLSTALGIAASSPGPTVLVVGDLSFLHDSAALAFAARERIALLVVVVNNDGGGIFSYLPLRDALAGREDVFERFFGTPHGADLSVVAALGGGFFARVEDPSSLDDALAAGLAASASGPAVVEVRTEREAARVAQQSIVRSAQAAAASAVLACTPAGDEPAVPERRIA
ncbi:MAG: 2-succinyl-5-enolpyruvyl-6-hydroxy-3-cyclohexene-1-carboxylic-acid synthase [Candidatus Binatia bacterium]